ncbi:hypothetical protein ACQ4WP_04605 [Janthinobacterium sp. GB4P2]|uniref:hypothetical protein n=1 Tax=Janthinobacterium sp. GB4P2 TaxID=3424189 RepID=UPI003F267CB5
MLHTARLAQVRLLCPAGEGETRIMLSSALSPLRARPRRMVMADEASNMRGRLVAVFIVAPLRLAAMPCKKRRRALHGRRFLQGEGQ